MKHTLGVYSVLLAKIPEDTYNLNTYRNIFKNVLTILFIGKNIIYVE